MDKDALELWQVVGNFSPGVAVGVVCLYFYNAMAVRYLEERREMVQQVITEREEWNAKVERLLDRYDTRLQSAVEAIAKISAEMHALRNKMQEVMTSMESKTRGIGND